jgi:hypothetical protein
MSRFPQTEMQEPVDERPKSSSLSLRKGRGEVGVLQQKMRLSQVAFNRAPLEFGTKAGYALLLYFSFASVGHVGDQFPGGPIIAFGIGRNRTIPPSGELATHARRLTRRNSQTLADF